MEVRRQKAYERSAGIALRVFIAVYAGELVAKLIFGIEKPRWLELLGFLIIITAVVLASIASWGKRRSRDDRNRQAAPRARRADGNLRRLET